MLSGEGRLAAAKVTLVQAVEDVTMLSRKGWIVSVLTVAGAFVVFGESAAAADAVGRFVPVGVARIDITPETPVRLVGYSGRPEESEGIAQRLWAKALAIGGDEGAGAAVLLMVENCGVPDEMTEAIARTLRQRHGLSRERFVFCSTHTHTGPWLTGFLPWHYINALPPEHQQHLDRYSEQLQQHLLEVVGEALAARRPCRLDWAEGKVAFAVNRRVLKDGRWAGFGVNPDGPVDHGMPILRAIDQEGNLTAVVLNYACHCVTLGNRYNEIHGDWAGCAQGLIEAEHPGTTALVTIGCGADQNPEPLGDLAITERHGRDVADEVGRLLVGSFHTLDGTVDARREVVRLPFGELPTREELESKASGKGGAADYARTSVEMLDRGEDLPRELEYPITTWTFGDDLAMVFLPGEAVVDYALRLKRELDGKRLWVTAYANGMPCYIASARMSEEGGYEVDRSMVSYAQPTRLAPAAEDIIIGGVRLLLGETFAGTAAP